MHFDCKCKIILKKIKKISMHFTKYWTIIYPNWSVEWLMTSNSKNPAFHQSNAWKLNVFTKIQYSASKAWSKVWIKATTMQELPLMIRKVWAWSCLQTSTQKSATFSSMKKEPRKPQYINFTIAWSSYSSSPSKMKK